MKRTSRGLAAAIPLAAALSGCDPQAIVPRPPHRDLHKQHWELSGPDHFPAHLTFPLHKKPGMPRPSYLWNIAFPAAGEFSIKSTAEKEACFAVPFRYARHFD